MTLDTESKSPMSENHTVPEKKAPEASKRVEKKPLPVLVKVVIGIVALVLIGFGLTKVVYSSSATNVLARASVRVVSFPAVKVNGETITMREYFDEYDALVNYFETISEDEPLPPEDELQDTIIDTLINKIAVQQLAAENEIVLDEPRVDEFFEAISLQNGNEDEFATEIAATFGWTPTDFRERIVVPIVIATQLKEYVNANVSLQATSREKIEAAYARLENGEEFIDVAKEINLDSGAFIETDHGNQNQSENPELCKEDVEDLEKG